MNIFLSYSKAQAAIAERLALSLRGDGHTVFFDRSDIEAGGEYDSRIRSAIEDCDFFVFLISAESVAPGSYPLAELRIAEERWNHPKGHVLPIVAQPTDIATIPPYLRAISVLDPRGDFVAESSAAIVRIARRRWQSAHLVLPIIAVALALTWIGYDRFERARENREQINRAIGAANTDLEAGQYSEAFRALGEAAAHFPGDPGIGKARERAAMLWLRNIRVRVGEQRFTDIVGVLRPVLSAGASVATGPEAGDLLAHLGWCEYLRARNGAANTDPVSYFKRAAEADPSNPYAHAMWGFWILYRNGPLAEADPHFRDAATSGRERRWVRNLQLAALISKREPAMEHEAIRVANAMRQEQVPVEQPDRLWSIYEYRLLQQHDSETFLQIILPADHLSTFRWLYSEASVAGSKLPVRRFLLGRLEEATGDHNSAISSYQWVEDYLRKQHSTGTLLDRTLQGLGRLGKETKARR